MTIIEKNTASGEVVDPTYIDPKEESIRIYLNALMGDQAFVDLVQERMAAHRSAADAATDPLEALLCIQKALDVRCELLAEYRKGCVTHLKMFCTAHNISLGALQEFGIPNDVLRDAGYRIPRGRPKGSKNRPKKK